MVRLNSFQFGTRRLMALTIIVAIIMAVAIRINIPAFAQFVLVGYCVFFISWAVIRVPSLYAYWIASAERRQQLYQRRRELEEECSAAREGNPMSSEVVEGQSRLGKDNTGNQ